MSNWLTSAKRFASGLLFGWRTTGAGDGAGPAWADNFQKRRSPTARQLIDEYKNVAYACANLNARAFASVQSHLYTTVGRSTPAPKAAHRGVSRHTKSWLAKNPEVSRKMAMGDDVVEITESPILDMMEAVNDELDGFVLNEMTDLYQEMAGRCYWYIETTPWFDDEEGNQMELPAKIWLIPPHWLQPIRTNQGITGYQFLRGGGDPIPAEEIVAFKFPNLRDPYGDGWSPARAAIESLDLSNKDLAWANTLLDNQARPDTVFRPKNGSMSREDARRLEKSIAKKFSRGGSGGPVVLQEDLDMTVLNYSSKQLELLARAGAMKVNTANAFDVPLPLLEAKEINRATLDAALVQHARHAILPRCRRHYQRLNAKFFPRFDPRLFMWFDNPVPEDEQMRVQVQGMELDKGKRTINECRAEDGDDPVAWGDRPWLPANLIQAGDDPTPTPDPAKEPPADPAPEPAADPATANAEEAAQTQEIQTAEANVLNGAQIQSALQIALAVASGELPRDAGLGMLKVLFNLTDAQAEQIMGSAGDGSDTTPNKPEPGSEPEPPVVPPPGTPGAPPAVQPPAVPPKPAPKPPEPKPPAKSAPVVDALVGHLLGELTRPAAIKALADCGIGYAKAFDWTAPRPLQTPPPHEHVEKAAHNRNLHVGAPGLKEKLKAIFKKQRAQVLKLIQKNAGALISKDRQASLGHLDLSEWDDEMASSCRPFIQLGFDAGGKDFEARNGAALGDGSAEWNVTQPKAKKAIDDATFKFCKETNATTSMKVKDALNKLREDLAEGILSDEQNTGRKLTEIVQGVFDEAEYTRAERIALTESSRAVHGGQVLAAKESGIVKGFKWLLSDNACPECQEVAEKNADGVGLDGSFAETDYGDVAYPPLHPYCQCSLIEVLDEKALQEE